MRLEATEAGWRELADELSHRIALAVTEPMRLLPPLPRPNRVWQIVALALAVLVVIMLPIAIHRHRPGAPAPAVEAPRASVTRPPPPPAILKRHHKKKR